MGDLVYLIVIEQETYAQTTAPKQMRDSSSLIADPERPASHLSPLRWFLHVYKMPWPGSERSRRSIVLASPQLLA
ncbi:hypothetical protein TomTYG45_10140 [Sphingobium sp. TomTYG45]